MTAQAVIGNRYEALPDQYHRGGYRAATALSIASLAFLAVETAGNRLLWRENDRTEVVGDGSAEYLAIAGLKYHDGKFIADHFEDHTSVDYLSYSSHDGISQTSLGHAVADYYSRQPQAGRLRNVFAHSMGLVSFLKGVEDCRRREIEIPHIDRIVALSSPMSINDIHRRGAIGVLAKSPYYGGPVCKAVGETVSTLIQERDLHQAAAIAMRAFRYVHQGQSNKLWGSQLHLLDAARTYAPGVFEGVLSEHTVLYDVANPDQDGVVDIRRARESKRRELVDQYGVQLVEVDVPDMCHADIATLPQDFLSRALSAEKVR